jgi:hypothetical protein
MYTCIHCHTHTHTHSLSTLLLMLCTGESDAAGRGKNRNSIHCMPRERTSPVSKRANNASTSLPRPRQSTQFNIFAKKNLIMLRRMRMAKESFKNPQQNEQTFLVACIRRRPLLGVFVSPLVCIVAHPACPCRNVGHRVCVTSVVCVVAWLLIAALAATLALPHGPRHPVSFFCFLFLAILTYQVSVGLTLLYCFLSCVFVCVLWRSNHGCMWFIWQFDGRGNRGQKEGQAARLEHGARREDRPQHQEVVVAWCR